MNNKQTATSVTPEKGKPRHSPRSANITVNTAAVRKTAPNAQDTKPPLSNPLKSIIKIKQKMPKFLCKQMLKFLSN